MTETPGIPGATGPSNASRDVFEVIWTTRAMRRLDPNRDVPESELIILLAAASKAPSGGNSQPVRWIVVRDLEVRSRLGEVYRKAARAGLTMYEERAKTEPAVARMLASALYLADHLGDAPAVLIPCAPSKLMLAGAAVYPAIQNLMLAARARGLGATLTTMHRSDESTVKEILGVPADVETYAFIPIGYPTGKFGEAPRLPLGETTYWDRWGKTRTDLTAPPWSDLQQEDLSN